MGMNFQELVNGFSGPTCIVSVKKTDDGSYEDIRIVAGNKQYLSAVEGMFGEAEGQVFVPDSPYENYIPKDIGFEDHTGNLRSSIGFKLFVDGEPVMENYRKVLNGNEGIAKGKALADEVGQRCEQDQIMLVVTAGMEYAIYVESRGRDVIASAEGLCYENLPQLRTRIEEMVRNAVRRQ